MRRGILIVLLAAGATLGFSLGFARLWGYQHGYGWAGRWHGPHAAFEDRIADACARGAERALSERHMPPPAAPARP